MDREPGPDGLCVSCTQDESQQEEFEKRVSETKERVREARRSEPDPRVVIDGYSLGVVTDDERWLDLIDETLDQDDDES